MKHEVNLGSLCDSGSQRDAIHVAVTPAVAFERLAPGAHVGFCGDKFGIADKSVGIVDPFLTQDVKKGETFWLLLYPQTITSLRHEWTHPEFVAAEPNPAAAKKESEAWLRKYAVTHNPYEVDYPLGGGGSEEKAFQHLLECLRCGEMFFHGSDLHGLYELDDADELKFHAERYLGIKINWGDFTFSCSC